MYKQIKAIIAMIIVSVIFYLLATFILFKGATNYELNLEEFQIKLEEFQKCYNKESVVASKLYHTNLLDFDEEELYRIMKDEFNTSCNTTFVVSSNKQIQDMALYLTTQTDYKFLDVVYTAPSRYYAIQGVPQEYLFIAMNEKKTEMKAFVVVPKDEYEIIEVFTSSDIDIASKQLQHLLLFYNEQVN